MSKKRGRAASSRQKAPDEHTGRQEAVLLAAEHKPMLNQKHEPAGFFAALRWLFAGLWLWPFTGVLAPLLYGTGINALYGGQSLLAATLFLISIVWIATKAASGEELRKHDNRLYIRLTIAIASVLVYIISVIWIMSRSAQVNAARSILTATNHSPSAPQQSEKSVSNMGVTTSIPIRNFFDKTPAFNIRIAPAKPFLYSRNGKSSTILGAVLVDGQAQVYSFSFFISSSADTAEICKDLARKLPYPYKSLLNSLRAFDNGDYFEHPTPETMLAIKHPKFSGKVFIYHESIIPLYKRAAIDKMFQAKQMEVEFRGPDYAQAQMYYTSVQNNAK